MKFYGAINENFFDLNEIQHFREEGSKIKSCVVRLVSIHVFIFKYDVLIKYHMS